MKVFLSDFQAADVFIFRRSSILSIKYQCANFCQGKKPKGDDKEIDAFQQIGIIKGETGCAGLAVDSDGNNYNAKSGRDKCLKSGTSERLDIAVRPSSIKAKYSTGPNETATDDRSGENSMSSTTLTVPPTNDAMAAMASAFPAFPCWAIG